MLCRMKMVLIDWLIALCVVMLITWFVFTQPLFRSYSTSNFLESQASIADNLYQHIHKLTLKKTVNNLKRNPPITPAEYISNTIESYGGSIQNEYYDSVGGQTRNIVLTVGPNTKDMIVIGTNYYHKTGTNQTYNASGIAILLELAHILLIHEQQLENKVQLIAYPYSGEDIKNMKLSGNYLHANKLKKLGAQVKLMIALDNFSKFSDTSGAQKFPYKFMRIFYPENENYISVIGSLQNITKLRWFKERLVKNTKLPVYSLNMPTQFSPAKSFDHISYQRLGFPSVLLSGMNTNRKPGNSLNTAENYTDNQKMAQLVISLSQVMVNSTSLKSSQFVVKN